MIISDLENKDKNYLDVIREIKKEHPDITNKAIASIMDKVIRWKESRLKWSRA